MKNARDGGELITYLGPPGTYSHEAALRRYGKAANLQEGSDFATLLEMLHAPRARRATIALLPVENAIEGPVTQSLDCLACDEKVFVTESFCLVIEHCLLASAGTKLESVQQLFSHPQALAQCSQWIHKNLPKAVQINCASTSEAAWRAASDPSSAAIASATAGALNGLRVLARKVQDLETNTTRFMAVRRQERNKRLLQNTPQGDEQRALLHVVLPNRSGALLHALQPFRTANLNLTFIQSRPLAGRPWEYAFFIEVQVTGQERAFQAVLDFLAAFMEHSRLLGRYSFRRRPLT